MLRLYLLFLTLLISIEVSALDLPTRKIEDDSSLRITILNSWLTGKIDQVLAQKPVTYTLSGGGRVQVRAEAGTNTVRIILARERNGSYPGWVQGSWILSRRRNSGTIEHITVFLRSDPNLYVRFRPFNTDKCVMDVLVYGAYLLQNLTLPFSIERLMVLPVEEVLAAAKTQFPRRYFESEPALYRDLRVFISQVRSRLPEVQFGDDGAIDASGRYVFINDLRPQEGDGGLNCSGFAKWLVDGILRPFTGTRLSIPPLKKPFGERGNSTTDAFERLRDPFFGLDWTRNLASIANATILSYQDIGQLSEIEVQKCPFTKLTASSGNDGIRSYPNYLKDAGFSFDGIEPLLYTLAVDEPGYVYLSSVNNDGGSPSMRTHFHVAALVPYFDEEGDFHVTVFESAEETSFNTFKKRYPGHFFNLVRIPVEGLFDP
ncbi:MAG: hypothetical protein LBB43_05135 [Spirochaetaceae bacterium]|jgi:hypothetical protein|nr:hypothetical protein [Spirochaetaceae bacterium]